MAITEAERAELYAQFKAENRKFLEDTRAGLVARINAGNIKYQELCAQKDELESQLRRIEGAVFQLNDMLNADIADAIKQAEFIKEDGTPVITPQETEAPVGGETGATE